MSSVNTQCRRIRRDLLRRDKLDAVGRSRLDVHLRRCEDCRDLAHSMELIENPGFKIPELDAERRDAIFARLAPTVERLTARVQLSCEEARDLLASKGIIEGISRVKLSSHLESCLECSLLADELEKLETEVLAVPHLTEGKRKDIYGRLVPAVHEIAKRNRKKTRSSWSWELRPNLVWAGAAAAAAVAIVILVSSDRTPEAFNPAGPPSIAALAEGRVDMDFSESEAALRGEEPFRISEILVDRVEGEILVDGELAGNKSSLRMRKGTRIASNAFGQFSFRIGEKARVALIGESRWELTEVSSGFLEMHLESGRIAVEFDGTVGQTMHVTTPTSIVRVKGTTFTVEALPEGITRVGVIEGLVEVAPRDGGHEAVEVAANQSVRLPLKDGIAALTDEQRAIAAELTHGQAYPAEMTRLVKFVGSPENVKVEVDGRVLGITPLTVRVPDGPHTYRLTAPGMAPVSGDLAMHSDYEEVGFELVPSRGHYPVLEDTQRKARQQRIARRAQPSESDELRGDEIDDSDANTGWDLFKRARAAMAAGDVRYAVRLLEKATEESEGDERVGGLSLLAECYTAVGEYRSAAKTFEEIIEMVPNSTAAQNARYEVARLAMDRLGDFSKARAFFRSYLSSPLGGALREEAHYSLCEINARQGAHRQALSCFDDFLKSFPNAHHEPEGRLWRGALYQDVEGNWAAAERDLRAFIDARPKHPRIEEALYRLAIGRFRLGDNKGSSKIISEYLSTYPRGRYRLRIEKLHSAISEYNSLLWEDEAAR